MAECQRHRRDAIINTTINYSIIYYFKPCLLCVFQPTETLNPHCPCFLSKYTKLGMPVAECQRHRRDAIINTTINYSIIYYFKPCLLCVFQPTETLNPHCPCFFSKYTMRLIIALAKYYQNDISQNTQ